MDKIIMTASSISVSELKANRKYLSVSMRMFSTRPNLNKCAVTEGFIDDIIANKGDYVCMGLFGDVKKLKSNDYKRGLTHLYDRKTGQFLAEQIGAFYDFEKVEDEYGTSLIGYARITKRSEAVCDAIERLYEEDSLNFSFEISAGVVEVVDGITIVDANPENELTGMAVVSVPAYPESKALDLVAENENMDKTFSNMLFISELDIEAVRMRLWNWMYDNFDGCCMRILLFCPDCFIMYDECCGKTYKVEYMVENDEMVIRDYYEVNFSRSEGSEKMNTDIEKVVEQEAVAEVVAEEVEQIISEETTEEIVSENIETAEESAEVEVAEEVVSEEVSAEEIAEETAEETAEEVDAEEMHKRCAELEAELEELRALKAQVEQAEAEKAAAEKAAQLKAEQDSLRALAQKEGLDVNEQKIAEIIEKCDYKALISEINVTPAKEETKNESYFAGYVSMAQKGSFSYLLERR